MSLTAGLSIAGREAEYAAVARDAATELHLGADVDVAFVAKQFAVTSSNIKKVPVDAKFLLVQDRHVVTKK